jgi:RimJ/RimL family protein N-acetyltransferase
VTFRPLGEDDLDVFSALPGASGSRHPLMDRDYLETVAQRHYRPEWSWVAVRDGRVLARAAWWGFPDADHPIALDWFDLGPDRDHVKVGAQLLEAAHEHIGTAEGRWPDYHLFLPPRWREQEGLRSGIAERMQAAESAGMRLFVERLRYVWMRNAGLPEPAHRLSFRTVEGSPIEEILRLLELVNLGTLDAHTLRDEAREGREAAARITLEELDQLPSPRSLWRFAYDPEGELVGITVPSRNFQDAVIGFVGVMPERRGRGYARDLLIEATRILAAEGAVRVIADTDVANRPMAAAFEATGYLNSAVRIVMERQGEMSLDRVILPPRHGGR